MNARFRNSGHGLELRGDRELEVVAGDALVVRGRLDLVAAPAGRIGRVHEEDAAAAAVLGRREVVGDRAVRRRLDVAVGLGQDAEPVAHGRARLGHRDLRGRDDLVRVVVVERGVVPERGEDPLAGRPCRRRPDPASRYSRASDSTWARPMSWISWALSDDRRVEADRRARRPRRRRRPSTGRACRWGGRAAGRRRGACRGKSATAGRTSLSTIAARRARHSSGSSTPRGSAVWSSGSSAIGVASQRVELVDGLADGEVGRGPAARRRPRDAGRPGRGSTSRCRGSLPMNALGDVGVGDRQLRDPDRQARLRAEDRVGAELVEAGLARSRPAHVASQATISRVIRSSAERSSAGIASARAANSRRLRDLARPRPRG